MMHSESGLLHQKVSIQAISAHPSCSHCIPYVGPAVIADAIKDNGAMTKIDISSNALCAAGGKALAEALKNNQVVTELNISSNYLGTVDGGTPDMSGVIALANVIPDMGAMTSLNLASNGLGAEGAKIVAEAIKVTMCTPAIIMAPFSCPSDFSNNCCCLLLSAGYGGDDEPEYQQQQHRGTCASRGLEQPVVRRFWRMESH
jgi:hypothetical protein